MIKVTFAGEFDSMHDDLVVGDMPLRRLIFKKVELFKKNPNDSRLDNHPLKKKLRGKWSFSITDDIRIIYRLVGKNTVRFLVIGPHKKVYR